jgi:hypothetical protein
VADDALFQLLPARLAGLPLDDILHEGVPVWLAAPLREWLARALHGDETLARRAVMRLRWNRAIPGETYINLLVSCDTDQLLIVVDAVLQLHPGWSWTSEAWDYTPVAPHGTVDWMGHLLTDLIQILIDAASHYTVDVDRHCLITQVDPTVMEAVNTAVAMDQTAGDHLRSAWGAAYGLNPDPDKAYDEAVLAVEALAYPLICPNNARRTLGTVIRDLRNQAGQGGVPDVV